MALVSHSIHLKQTEESRVRYHIAQPNDLRTPLAHAFYHIHTGQLALFSFTLSHPIVYWTVSTQNFFNPDEMKHETVSPKCQHVQNMAVHYNYLHRTSSSTCTKFIKFIYNYKVHHYMLLGTANKGTE